MSTSIRVSEETKEMLDRLKREDETFDELLARLAGEEDPVDAGAWDDETTEQAMERLRSSRESFGR